MMGEIENFTLKACAKVAAATDGDTFDRLVVVFLKRTFRCIRVARLGASEEFDEFAISMVIKVLNSSPYYAQANGKAKASNKGIIKLIKRKIEENPRRWHTLLNEALWSYRMACHGSTKVSPYQLVYGHNAVLPWKIKTGSRWMFSQDQLTAYDYATLMKDELDDLAEHRL